MPKIWVSLISKLRIPIAYEIPLVMFYKLKFKDSFIMGCEWRVRYCELPFAYVEIVILG